jgi:serine/threonine protein kinase
LIANGVLAALSVGALVKCERDSYKLTHKISTGGMGTVWEARSSVGRRVVVKEPLINNDNDGVKIERLLIEAAVLRKLNDELKAAGIEELIRTHMVRYVDRLTNRSHPFLVTEYLPGQTASQAYARTPLRESDAVREVVILLGTIGAIHSKGVIHRDISPSNILLADGRGPVLIDFGASIVLKGDMSVWSANSGRVVFKRGFSAPELLEGRADAMSDVYSVGATLFYFLTGRNPGDFIHTPAEGMGKLPKEVDSRISISASEVILRAMSPNPTHRFQSALEMGEVIKTHLVQSVIPTLTIGGVVYELRPGFVDVGRAHTCGADCKSLGYEKPIQIRVNDPQSYIEKHHVRIWVDPSGQCSIEDLRSVNHTAIKRGNSTFQILSPALQEPLRNEDIVGLAYTPDRGPYLTFLYNDGRRGSHQ